MKHALAMALLVALMAIHVAARAAPPAEPWARWAASDPASTSIIDHGKWDRFLQRETRVRADGVTLVAYGAVNPDDRRALDRYIAMLAGLPIGRYARAEQRAYWINLYNALTVQTVLAHYPIQSIRDINISPGLFTRGPWGKKLVTIEGEAVSLDDIEHRILRPLWRDPRIHYALNCAALGCPSLVRRAFTGDNTEAMLSEAARVYVNHPRGAQIDHGRLVVSSIYRWYIADFGGSDAAVVAHLEEFADAPLRAALTGRSMIDADRYDWTLNDAPR